MFGSSLPIEISIENIIPWFEDRMNESLTFELGNVTCYQYNITHEHITNLKNNNEILKNAIASIEIAPTIRKAIRKLCDQIDQIISQFDVCNSSGGPYNKYTSILPDNDLLKQYYIKLRVRVKSLEEQFSCSKIFKHTDLITTKINLHKIVSDVNGSSNVDDSLAEMTCHDMILKLIINPLQELINTIDVLEAEYSKYNGLIEYVGDLKCKIHRPVIALLEMLGIEKQNIDKMNENEYMKRINKQIDGVSMDSIMNRYNECKQNKLLQMVAAEQKQYNKLFKNIDFLLNEFKIIVNYLQNETNKSNKVVDICACINIKQFLSMDTTCFIKNTTDDELCQFTKNIELIYHAIKSSKLNMSLPKEFKEFFVYYTAQSWSGVLLNKFDYVKNDTLVKELETDVEVDWNDTSGRTHCNPIGKDLIEWTKNAKRLHTSLDQAVASNDFQAAYGNLIDAREKYNYYHQLELNQKSILNGCEIQDQMNTHANRGVSTMSETDKSTFIMHKPESVISSNKLQHIVSIVRNLITVLIMELNEEVVIKLPEWCGDIKIQLDGES